MKESLKLVLLSVFLFTSTAIAQDKVVVIPLFKSVKPLQNVITVSKSGGDFTDPVAAVNSISGAASDNPYLVVIGPGEYTLTGQLNVGSYISIVGSGEYATRIGGAINGSNIPTGALVKLTGTNSSISNLYLENIGGGSYSAAIYADAFTGTLENITAKASGGATSNYGIYNQYSAIKMSHVTADARGGTYSFGVYSAFGMGSAPTRYSRMTNVLAYAKNATNNYGVMNYKSYPMMAVMAAVSDGYGIYIDDSTAITTTYIRRSTIIAGQAGIYVNTDPGGMAYVSQSTIQANPSKDGTGGAKCIASDDNSGIELPDTCF